MEELERFNDAGIYQTLVEEICIRMVYKRYLYIYYSRIQTYMEVYRKMRKDENLTEKGNNCKW